ncbi:cytidine and dCMP deaminase domain-containing protein 1-like [Porites lutea]|uniref:cytidine and dCMP deaminase domain-containing protein 1-like n=1 Tax=Porites lutea TaxID=51062 RepID=UPI003CC6C0FF
MADNTQPNVKEDENALKTPSSDGNGAVTSDNKMSTLKRRVNIGICRESLFLTMAMCMEMFPEPAHHPDSDSPKTIDQSSNSYRKIGCVLVHQKEYIVAVDRSREGVHGVARLLVKHHDKTMGCSMYISRKPCPYCSKLLAKSGVTSITYPPAETEFYNEKEERRVDTLLNACGITQTVLVPQMQGYSAIQTEEQQQLFTKGIPFRDIQEYTENVLRRFWSKERVRYLICESIEQTYSEFENLVKWMAQIHISLTCSKLRCSGYGFTGERELGSFDPENNLYQEQIAKHLLGLASMTIQATVEPKTGVGCVILKGDDVVAIGWNDFPSQKIEEEFHDSSDLERDKYPFFVHAEQNALLRCNVADISGSTLFVTKMPCHECTPLVKVAGIGTVVLATSLEPITEKYKLNYEVFQQEVGKGNFICFELI